MNWHPVVRSDKFGSLLRSAAQRVGDTQAIEVAKAAAARQTAYPDSIHWQGYSIAQGFSGLAIASAYFGAYFPNDDWENIGHRYLLQAVRSWEESHGRPLGLFAGLSGVAFAADSLSKGGTRYGKLLAKIDSHLAPGVVAQCDKLRQQAPGCSVSQFDAISGLAGIGVYLMNHRQNPGLAAALESVLLTFVHLSEETSGLPRWHSPPALLDKNMLERFPSGNINLGLAHGISGPLALMSKALNSGVHADGLEEAVNRISQRLCAAQLTDECGVGWPDAVSLVNTENLHGLLPSRPAWCYGSAGVARALWLAGTALGNAQYQELALRVMDAAYARLRAMSVKLPATFCHGLSGLLQITLRFQHDTGLDVFSREAGVLTEQIRSSYDPETPLGFYCVEPGNRRVDNPGMLDGSPGVVMTLLAATGSVEPAWDSLFLI